MLDWFSNLTQEDLWGSKDQVGILPASAQIATSGIQAYTSFEQMKVAQDNLALQKESFAFNKQQSVFEALANIDTRQRALSRAGKDSAVLDTLAEKYSAQIK